MTKPKTRDQVITPPNPTGKGGFGDHPENRNKGTWNSEDSISFQYNKLMRMSPDELAEFVPVTVAQEIALARIKQAKKDTGLMDTKEITDRTEGKAPQNIDVTSGGDKLNVALVQFVGDDDADSTKDTNQAT
jgi:hypothetical protein